MIRVAVPFLLALPLVALPRPAGATSYDVNLIVNGDAEACTPGPTGYEIVAIPGWSRAGNLTAVAWSTPGGFPTGTSPGPADRGIAFFAGGDVSPTSEIWQEIDVSDLAAPIDAGTVDFRLAGYFGGFGNQADHALLRVSFLDALAEPLGNATIGPVTITDRALTTGLLLRTAEGDVPSGTRSVFVQLSCTRFAGTYNDGYADSLAFALTAATVGVGDPPSTRVEFAPVFPNPARGVARFAFRLPAASDLRLDVLDVHGRSVAAPAAGRFPAGAHSVAWPRGDGVPPGVYFARLKAGAHELRRRFVVID